MVQSYSWLVTPITNLLLASSGMTLRRGTLCVHMRGSVGGGANQIKWQEARWSTHTAGTLLNRCWPAGHQMLILIINTLWTFLRLVLLYSPFIECHILLANITSILWHSCRSLASHFNLYTTLTLSGNYIHSNLFEWANLYCGLCRKLHH